MSDLDRLEELRKKIIKKTVIGIIIAVLAGILLIYITEGQLGIIMVAIYNWNNFNGNINK